MRKANGGWFRHEVDFRPAGLDNGADKKI